MTTLAQTIRDYVAQAHVNYGNVRKRIMEKAAAANNDLEPTEDRHGRLHAPCDGYEWESDIYPGGAYLPFPQEFWEMLEERTGRPCGPSSASSNSYGSKQRVKVTTQEAEEIQVACAKFAEVSIGKTWDDGVTCYVYIQTTRTKLIELIADYRAEQEAALKAIRDAEKAARQALKGEAPEGRCVVKGRIVCFKRVERDRFSYYDSGVDYKMLVELENLSTVWGSQPSNIGDAEVGDEVQFTATFQRAEGDNTHAFYKRPTKFTFTPKEKLGA